MPTTFERLNGKGGKFKAPKTLSSQFENEGSDNYSSIKIPLQSIEFVKNNEVLIKNTVIKDNNNTRPSTNIIFKFSLKDWFVNAREVFSINTAKDFAGRVNITSEIEEALKELRDNYIKCFSPRIEIPQSAGNSYDDLKFFKSDIEQDYYENYEYHIYYIEKETNKKNEISSIEQGAVKFFFNDDYAAWSDENADQEYKNQCLKTIYNNSIIEISLNNKDVNKYLQKKEYKKVLKDCDVYTLSDCGFLNNKNSAKITRNINSVGYITLKYLRQEFKDNYVSIPNSIKWIGVKNGLKDEYASNGDDREVAIKC